MSWFESSMAYIQAEYLNQIQSGKTDKAEIRKAINDSYPFGERARLPYKAWLKARKEFFTKYGLHDLNKLKLIEKDLFD
ncbi:MAG: hypothetical protein PHT07_20770 [Paludibacter sp.]|nr:hypothetical protein [Paludibacter sp.]